MGNNGEQVRYSMGRRLENNSGTAWGAAKYSKKSNLGSRGTGHAKHGEELKYRMGSSTGIALEAS
jgi:hypothetical protein